MYLPSCEATTEWQVIGEHITVGHFISMWEESSFGNVMATKDHFGRNLNDIEHFCFKIEDGGPALFSKG